MTDNPLLTYQEAAAVLSEHLGRTVTATQLRSKYQREPNAFPFYKDPLSGVIMIRKKSLLEAWDRAEAQALKRAGMAA